MHRLDTCLVLLGLVLRGLEFLYAFPGFGEFLLDDFGFLVAHAEALDQWRQAVLPVDEFLVKLVDALIFLAQDVLADITRLNIRLQLLALVDSNLEVATDILDLSLQFIASFERLLHRDGQFLGAILGVSVRCLELTDLFH